MGLELGRAWIRVRGDLTGLRPDLTQAKRQVEEHVASMGNSLSRAIAGIGAVTGSYVTMLKALTSAGQYEQTSIAFETMMGSAKKAQDTLKNLTDFAAKTPFEMPEILQAARGLIQFGERGNELMETLNILGNAASGTSSRFGDIALIFNQIRGVGKLLTQDFRQLSTRGVISLQDIAKHFKVTTDVAQQMLSKGRISFEDVRNILKELSSEGGRFANMMEKQSHSLLGLWSTLKDAIGITTRAVGEGLAPIAKHLVSVGIAGMEAIRNIVGENKTLVSSFLASTVAVTALSGAFVSLSAAARIAGLSMKAALIGTGVGIALVAVGTAVGLVINKINDMVQSWKKFKDSAEFAMYKKSVENLSAAFEHLKNAISNIKSAIVAVSLEILRMFGVTEETIQNLPASISQFFQVLFSKVSESIKQWSAWLETLSRRWDLAWDYLIVSAKLKLSEFRDTFVSTFKYLVEYARYATTNWQALISGSLAPMPFTPYQSGTTANLEKQRKDIASQFNRELQQTLNKPKDAQPMLGPMYAAGKSSLGTMFAPWLSLAGKIGEKFSGVKNSLEGITSSTKEWVAELKKIQTQGFWKSSSKLAEMRQELKWLVTDASDFQRAFDQFKETPGTTEEQARQFKLLYAGIEANKKPESLISAGRYGFSDFFGRIQDALLQKDDPQRKLVNLTQEELKALNLIESDLRRLSTGALR